MRRAGWLLIGLLAASASAAPAQEPPTPAIQPEKLASYPGSQRFIHSLMGDLLPIAISYTRSDVAPQLKEKLSRTPQVKRLPQKKQDWLNAYVDGYPDLVEAELKTALPRVEELLARDMAQRVSFEAADELAGFAASPTGQKVFTLILQRAASKGETPLTSSELFSQLSENEKRDLLAFSQTLGGQELGPETKALGNTMKAALENIAPDLKQRVHDDMCRELAGPFCKPL